MNPVARISQAHLRGEILRTVSRSFYLSISLLPHRVQAPVALAYLLARATDTIADTTAMSAGVRTEQLRNFADVIAGRLPNSDAARVRDVFAPHQTESSERALIEALPECVDWLAGLDRDDRKDVRAVLARINAGQALDVIRFPDADSVRALATAEELDEYTYLVAGCVGEFWTQICFRWLPNFSDLAEAEMVRLGVGYGKGLQLINILRDAGADLRAGRCYLPQDQLEAAGIAPDELLQKPERAGHVLSFWQAKARSGLEAGIDYACAIRNRRVRFATALPALIGARTLALLKSAGPDALQRNVKIGRAEVRRILSSVALTLGSSRSIRWLFERLSK